MKIDLPQSVYMGDATNAVMVREGSQQKDVGLKMIETSAGHCADIFNQRAHYTCTMKRAPERFGKSMIRENT